MAGSLPFFPQRFIVRGEIRSKSATSRIVIKSGKSERDTFGVVLLVSDMVCIIKDQISKSKYQKEIVSLFHGSIVKNNQAIEQYSNCYTVIVKEYLQKNYKIYLSILLSLIIVLFIIPIFATPRRLMNLISKIKIPKFNFGKLFTLNFDQTTTQSEGRSRLTPTENITGSVNYNYISPIPTIKGSKNLTPTPIINNPSSIISKNPTPTIYIPDDDLVDFPIENDDINNIPGYPTNVPKPTKPPKPSPTPLAPPEYLRPGTGLEDIFKKAGELACVPPALLKAFVAQEAPGVLNWSDQTALFYNAYDWWHRVKEKSQVCGGYGYYTHTGLIPEDSLFAGEKCKDPFSPETANDTYSRLLGSCQMLRSYWEKDFKEPTRQKLKVKQVDRRVLIDCLIGYGIHFRKDSGYTGGCNNWALKDVAKAACVNTGVSCDVYNYCYKICNNYNKYAYKNFNCNSASSFFVPGTCQFK